MAREFCLECNMKDECDSNKTTCHAVKILAKMCRVENNNTKSELLRQYAKELNIIECEVSTELQELGEKIIKHIPEVGFINDYDIKVGYVMSYEAKQAKGKSVNADCKKINGTYKAFLPFDFVITFYEPNIYHMTDNQKKVLMLHELKHIGIGEKGLRIENHDVEDFISILQKHGMDWNDINSEDIIDILAGGDSEG